MSNILENESLKKLYTYIISNPDFINYDTLINICKLESYKSLMLLEFLHDYFSSKILTLKKNKSTIFHYLAKYNREDILLSIITMNSDYNYIYYNSKDIYNKTPNDYLNSKYDLLPLTKTIIIQKQEIKDSLNDDLSTIINSNYKNLKFTINYDDSFKWLIQYITESKSFIKVIFYDKYDDKKIQTILCDPEQINDFSCLKYMEKNLFPFKLKKSKDGIVTMSTLCYMYIKNNIQYLVSSSGTIQEYRELIYNESLFLNSCDKYKIKLKNKNKIKFEKESKIIKTNIDDKKTNLYELAYLNYINKSNFIIYESLMYTNFKNYSIIVNEILNIANFKKIFSQKFQQDIKDIYVKTKANSSDHKNILDNLFLIDIKLNDYNDIIVFNEDITIKNNNIIDIPDDHECLEGDDFNCILTHIVYYIYKFIYYIPILQNYEISNQMKLIIFHEDLLELFPDLEKICSKNKITLEKYDSSQINVDLSRNLYLIQESINQKITKNNFKIITKSNKNKEQDMKDFLKYELKIQEKEIEELLKKYENIIQDTIKKYISETLFIKLLKCEQNKTVANNADLIINHLL